MPTMKLTPEFQPVAQLVRAGVDHVPEGALVDAAITLGQRQFRLSREQVVVLTSAFKDVYGKLAADPMFAGIGSALGEVVSDDPARPGHYFLYRPELLTPQTRAIVFLHGFGGNFQFYTWLLKEEFPDSIIIAPSYGIAWRADGQAYLSEVLADAENRLRTKLSHPWLVALSAGGPAGFAIYNDSPTKFFGLVALATCPQSEQIPNLRNDLNVLMMNGLRDDRFPLADVRRVIQPLSPRMRQLELIEIDGDHFFLLTARRDTFNVIRKKLAARG
jgi:predicted esterase